MAMWIWLTVLTVTNIATIVFLISMIRIKAAEEEKTKPTEYMVAIQTAHDQYITDVTKLLNHEHAVPLTKEDVVNSSLFYFTTIAMAEDLPVSKCATAIVRILDDLMNEEQN